MLRRIISWIPNSITCLNLLSGCAATICSFHLGETMGGLEMAYWVYIFIGAAALFDFCDGAAARLLKAYSLIGKELDSLSDLVSFGIAPAMLVMNTMLAAGNGWLSYFALFIPVMGALRLAKFNVDDRQTTSFIGLPIPANAIFWTGAVAWMNEHVVPAPWITLILVAAVSLLMVSEIPMFSLKFKNFAWRENVRRYAVIIAAILFVIFEGIPGLAWSIIFYLVISIPADRTKVAE